MQRREDQSYADFFLQRSKQNKLTKSYLRGRVVEGTEIEYTPKHTFKNRRTKKRFDFKKAKSRKKMAEITRRKQRQRRQG